MRLDTAIMAPDTIVSELSPRVRTRLVREAMRVGKGNGYCDEMSRLLNLMGFSVPIFTDATEIANYRDPEDHDADSANHHHH